MFDEYLIVGCIVAVAVVLIGSLIALAGEDLILRAREYITDTKDPTYCYKTVTFMNAIAGRSRREHRGHRLYENMIINKTGKVVDSDNGVIAFWGRTALLAAAVAFWPATILAVFGWALLRLARFTFRVKTKLDLHVKDKDSHK